jgi:hypothetical protein
LTEQSYDSEDLLQRLLAQYPNLLAGSQIDKGSPRRWLLISREISVPDSQSGPGRWSVDHLFLDQDSIPTLVEVKRSYDTRIRREVVGQMLDYAANAVTYWPIEEIRLKFETRCENDSINPEQVLTEFLGEDSAFEQFWEKLKINLRAGKIRMLFVADEIPAELQRIIEFLNGQMTPAEVLGVEVKQYIGQNLRTLVPRIIGQTSEKLTPRWGRGKISGSFALFLKHNDKEYKIFSISTEGGGKLWFQFGDYGKYSPFDSPDKRNEFRLRLNSIPGISIAEEGINKYPTSH